MNFYEINILIIYLVGIYFTLMKSGLEMFENNLDSNNEAYNKNFLRYYKLIFDMKEQVASEVKQIDKSVLSIVKNKQSISILDGGCGVGTHTNLLQTQGYKVIGVDRSRNMLKEAEFNNIFNTYICGELSDIDLFNHSNFSHIISNSDSFYQNSKKLMKRIMICYYKWLKDGGFLIFYLINNKNLDPSPRDYSQYYKDNQGNVHSLTYFKGFSHNAWFMVDKEREDGYNYHHKIVLEKTRQTMIKIIKYTIPDRSYIISLITDTGFNFYSSLDIAGNEITDYEILVFRKKKSRQ